MRHHGRIHAVGATALGATLFANVRLEQGPHHGIESRGEMLRKSVSSSPFGCKLAVKVIPLTSLSTQRGGNCRKLRIFVYNIYLMIIRRYSQRCRRSVNARE